MACFALKFEFLYSNPGYVIKPIRLFELMNLKSKVRLLKFRLY